MTELYLIILSISLAAVLFSYAIYPLLLMILAAGKENSSEVYSFNDLPDIAILIAAHNEEKVIEEKLQSIFDGDYPLHKINIYIGSDCSTDKTESIVSTLAQTYSNIKLTAFKERMGKVRIINKLAGEATAPILIITDANVIFAKDTLVQLVKHFANKSIALVDSNMLHKGLKKEGISHEESFYIRGEVSSKYAEGKIWGAMMGPFGGCYALRKDYFSPVPENFLVDDFYINMKVLEKGGKAITEVKAIVYEDISNELVEEFRRKVRIATGSFQNLFVFMHMLFRFNAISFCFFSHKVLRWFGPIFLMLAYICSFLLACHSDFFRVMFYCENGLIALALLDYVLQQLNIHIRVLRLLRHFFSMNFALLVGMLRAITGVNSSIWQPTQRHQ